MTGPFLDRARLIPAVAASQAERLTFIPLQGELVVDSSTGTLYVGDGRTYGGIPVGFDSSRLYGIPFEVTGVLTSAAAATPVVLLADALVPVGKAVYINWWMVTVGGATAWTDVTGTIVTIQDTGAVVALTFAKAGLTANAMLVPGSANTTLAALITAQSGLTAAKGIQVVADHIFAAGSNLMVTVGGVIK